MKLRSLLTGFLEGLGSVFDPLGKDQPEELELHYYRNDAEAIRADWEAVGRDMRQAMGAFVDENGLEQEETPAGRSKIK